MSWKDMAGISSPGRQTGREPGVACVACSVGSGLGVLYHVGLAVDGVWQRHAITKGFSFNGVVWDVYMVRGSFAEGVKKVTCKHRRPEEGRPIST